MTTVYDQFLTFSVIKCNTDMKTPACKVNDAFQNAGNDWSVHTTVRYFITSYKK